MFQRKSGRAIFIVVLQNAFQFFLNTDKIPVKQITNEQNKYFREALNKIQYYYTKECARLIDSMIFDLYNLSEDERQIIGGLEIQ